MRVRPPRRSGESPASGRRGCDQSRVASEKAPAAARTLTRSFWEAGFTVETRTWRGVGCTLVPTSPVPEELALGGPGRVLVLGGRARRSQPSGALHGSLLVGECCPDSMRRQAQGHTLPRGGGSPGRGSGVRAVAPCPVSSGGEPCNSDPRPVRDPPYQEGNGHRRDLLSSVWE